MSLPNFINKDDVFNHLGRRADFYRADMIPIGVIREKDSRWVSIVQFAEIGGKYYHGKLWDVFLPENHQLASLKEVVEEVCDMLGLKYLDPDTHDRGFK